MIQIIRIEYYTGDGLFRAEDILGFSIINNLKCHDELCSKHKRFPTAYKEFKDDLTSEHYCAFKSLKQLGYWIKKEWIAEIISIGFKIYLIDIEEEHCLIGTRQIAFKKENIISKKDISQLFN